VKLNHAVEFLCEEIKVKITLRFRGREMMHKEFGFQQVEKFIHDVAAYGHPDAPPKLIGKGINVMLSPLPRNKRGKNPHEGTRPRDAHVTPADNGAPRQPASTTPPSEPVRVSTNAAAQPANFGHNPFASLDLKLDSSS
jgi:translation initiation factor IF-3